MLSRGLAGKMLASSLLRRAAFFVRLAGGSLVDASGVDSGDARFLDVRPLTLTSGEPCGGFRSVEDSTSIEFGAMLLGD